MPNDSLSLPNWLQKNGKWTPAFVFTLFALTLIGTFLGSTPATAQAQTNLQVRLQDAGISPASFSAQSGAKVNITVINQGKKVHNLVIPDFYIFTQNLNPGEQVKVSFTPDKIGAFPYYSDTGGQPEPGLQGTIRVHE